MIRATNAFYASCLIAFSILGACDATTHGASHEVGAPEKIAVRVLYAGNPDSERSKDFAAHLEEHFVAVQTADYEEFTPDKAKDFDVVIFDWTSIYPRGDDGKITWSDKVQLAQPAPPKIDRSFSKPCVLIGAAGGSITHQLNIAINWKCLCLENTAHDVMTDHAVFHQPLPVEIEYDERDKPLDYYTHPGMERIGEKINVWKVQEKTFPEIDPGLVSSRENFTDTPDAEVISGGVNGKGPTSVAIGRHGNFLLWGFSGQPSEMTESGRRAFINAVCYIKDFDGQTAGPVQSTYGGRDSLLEQVYSLRSTSDAYLDKQVEYFQKMIRDNPPPESTLKEIGGDPAAYFRKMFEPHAQEIRKKLPKAVREECQDETEKLIRYYRDNLEYLRSDREGGFVVDEDARTLGVSNRSPQLLEKCVALLEQGEQSELATRVLERYTRQSHEQPSQWRDWLNASAQELQYDETEGVFSF